MFTDSHCHVLSSEYPDINNIIANLKDNNIKRIVNNGYNLLSNQEVVLLSNNNSNIYGALGMHPDNVNEDIKANIDYIKANISNPKIIAVGEIGLDFFHNKNNKEEQIKLFEELLKIAEENNKPVIIHSREANSVVISILKQHHNKGIIHCFNGSIETAKEFIKLGFKLGINGVITFKNCKLSETLKVIPLSNLLVETDSPYLSPEPLRGTVNEPKNIVYVINKLQEIYHLSENDLALELEKNYQDIFN